MEKVILISIDGMRPDGLKMCKNDYLDTLVAKSSYAFDGRTVFPSVTLACHMSMFQSVPPERHGTTWNDYVVPAKPVKGIFEQLSEAGKTTAMFYGWDFLRDISRPGSLTAAEYVDRYAFEHTDAMLTEKAISYIKKAEPDFVFLYMVETDDKGGHSVGWMSDVYLDYIYHAINNVKRVIEEVGDKYTVIVTSDHGGHDRMHGTDMPEDMTIPAFFCGKKFKPGVELQNVSILDIAPTVVDLLGVPAAQEWEGKSLVNN